MKETDQRGTDLREIRQRVIRVWELAMYIIVYNCTFTIYKGTV